MAIFLVLLFAAPILAQDCVVKSNCVVCSPPDTAPLFGVPWLPEVQRRIKVTVDANEAMILLSNQARGTEATDDHYRIVLDGTMTGLGSGFFTSSVLLNGAVVKKNTDSINFLTLGTPVDIWIDVYTSPAGHQRVEILDENEEDIVSWTNPDSNNRVYIRYVGVRQWATTGGSFTFCDVLPILRSQGQPAIQSSTQSEFEAALAVDGHEYTDFTKLSCTQTTENSENWWRVDLGEEYDIKMVILFNRAKSNTDRLIGAKVLVGSCPVANRDDNKECDGIVTSTEANDVDGIPILRSCAPNTYGRYVYVEGAQSVLTLCEVKVYGEIITDDLKTKLYFANGTKSQMETQSELTVPVQRVATYPTCTGADISFTDGSATKDSDYTILDTSVFFGPHDELQEIRMRLIDDEEAESSEDLTVGLVTSSVVGATTGYGDETEVKILDDDSVTYKFSQATYPVKESIGSVVIEVTREGGTANPGDIVLTKTLGTALPVSDYINERVELHFDKDVTSQTGEIGIVDDTNVEVTKEFYVGIEVLTSYGNVDPTADRTTVFILDDDDEFYLDRTAIEVTESQSAEIVVKRRGAAELDSTVELHITASSAHSGTDFTSNNIITLEFKSGVDTISHSITLVDDTFGEDDEVFYIELRSNAGEVLDGEGMATVTIKDDDARYILKYVYHSVSELDKTVAITVLRTGFTGITTTARLSTAFISASNGDFTSLLYYPVIFNKGDESKTITIVIHDDPDPEPLETFQVFIDDADGFIGSPSEALVTIIDNDSTVSLKSGFYTVTEEQALFTVDVSRDGVLDNTCSVRLLSSTGSATSADYVAVDETLLFPVDWRSLTVTVQIIPDNIHEEDEIFFLILSSAVNVSLGEIKEATVTLISSEDVENPQIDETDPSGLSSNALIAIAVSSGVGVILIVAGVVVFLCLRVSRMSKAPKATPRSNNSPSQYDPNQVQTDPMAAQMELFSNRFGVGFGNSAMQLYGGGQMSQMDPQMPALPMPTTYREMNGQMILSNQLQSNPMPYVQYY